VFEKRGVLVIKVLAAAAVAVVVSLLVLGIVVDVE
jgi:hypothetical protein